MKAYVFAYFGTERKEAQERLLSFVSAFSKELPDSLVIPMAIKDKIVIKEKLLGKSVDEVRIIALVLEDGHVYHTLESIRNEWSEDFGTVSLSTPILDSKEALQRLLDEFDEKPFFLLHGTSGKTSKAAETINSCLGENKAFTLKEYPNLMDNLPLSSSDVVVAPLFLTYGVHVMEDIAGKEDSLFASLRKLGFQPRLSTWTLLDSSFLFEEVKSRL